MIKTMFLRIINSFCYGIAVTLVIYFVIMMTTDHIPLLPEYAMKFDNDVTALVVQLVLIGLMSASMAGGTVIMEIEKWSLLFQSILYFFFSSIIWILVASYCWGFGKYIQTAVSVTLSYLISYCISWMIQYKSCKKSIDEINQRLERLGQAE